METLIKVSSVHLEFDLWKPQIPGYKEALGCLTMHLWKSRSCKEFQI